MFQKYRSTAEKIGDNMKMVGIIFSNIYDATMGELTKHRTVASLPFGGRYRQIDFVLSNMVNSGMSSVGIITKYNYQSLMDHLGSCSEWDMNRKNGGVFILPPFGTGVTSIYKGKIEALYGAVAFLEKVNAEYVVMSDSTVLCNIDYDKVLEQHIASGADVTVIANKEQMDTNEVQDLVLEMDNQGKVTDLAIQCAAGENSYIGMGMYIINRQLLLETIQDSVAHGLYHFERDFLQRKYMKNQINIGVYHFERTVLRNRNITAYFRNNLKLMDDKVRGEIFCENSPIYTKVRDEVPTYYGDDCEVDNCLIADGCKIDGVVEDSIIFRDVTIEKGCHVKNCIIMQGTTVSKGTNLEYVIIDKDVVITENRTLIGADTTPIIINKGEKV